MNALCSLQGETLGAHTLSSTLHVRVLWNSTFFYHLTSLLAGKRRALIPPEVGYTDTSLEPLPLEVMLLKLFFHFYFSLGCFKKLAQALSSDKFCKIFL